MDVTRVIFAYDPGHIERCFWSGCIGFAVTTPPDANPLLLRHWLISGFMFTCCQLTIKPNDGTDYMASSKDKWGHRGGGRARAAGALPAALFVYASLFHKRKLWSKVEAAG